MVLENWASRLGHTGSSRQMVEGGRICCCPHVSLNIPRRRGKKTRREQEHAVQYIREAVVGSESPLLVLIAQLACMRKLAECWAGFLLHYRTRAKHTKLGGGGGGKRREELLLVT